MYKCAGGTETAMVEIRRYTAGSGRDMERCVFGTEVDMLYNICTWNVCILEASICHMEWVTNDLWHSTQQSREFEI